MGIRIGGGEELETFYNSDAVTVNNLGKKKPPLSPSISSSSISPTSASVVAVVSSAEPVINPVKVSYGSNVEEEEEFDWVAVDKEVDFIMDKAPELDEVDDAFSALQL